MKKLLYFGCVRSVGHYLWVNEGNSVCNVSALKLHTGITGVTDNFIRGIDGFFTPPNGPQGAYRVARVEPFLIVAWNDLTVDSRPGSNSVLLGIGYASADEILDDAINHFPSVMRRQTTPLHPI